MKERGKYEGQTRRDFLKTTAYGAGVYAGIGTGVGAAYNWIRDLTRKGTKEVGNALVNVDEKVQESIERGNKVIEPVYNAEKALADFQRKLLGRTPEDQAEWRNKKGIKHPSDYVPENKKEEISRRGFFKTLLGVANQYPIPTGSIAGATYGAGKTALKERSSYVQKRETARLKDTVEYQGKKIEELEKAIKKRGNQEGDLENKINTTNLIILPIIILTLISSIGLSISKITGFSIIGTSSAGNTKAIIFLLIIGTILLTVYFKNKKNIN